MKRILAGALCLLATPALAQAQSDSLPQAMLGTWCLEKGDELGELFRRCARGESGGGTMQPHAMFSKNESRVKSVEGESATSWWGPGIFRNFPTTLYRWRFSGDGQALRRMR